LSLSATNALLNMIDHLETRGVDRQQAYALCSVAVDLRISQTVDVPNLLVSALLPLDTSCDLTWRVGGGVERPLVLHR
jgi:formamidase